MIGDDAYLNGAFVTTVQQRGAAIIAARKLDPRSAPRPAFVTTCATGSRARRKGTWTSMGVISPGGDQAYGIAEGLMYSFPVTCEGGKWQIVQGLPIDERSRALMDATAEELAEEKAMAEAHRRHVSAESRRARDVTGSRRRDTACDAETQRRHTTRLANADSECGLQVKKIKTPTPSPAPPAAPPLRGPACRGAPS